MILTCAFAIPLRSLCERRAASAASPEASLATGLHGGLATAPPDLAEICLITCASIEPFQQRLRQQAGLGTDEAVEKGFNAGAVIKQISREIKGGGGGKPTMAQAGGKDASGIDAALDAARKLFA